MFPIVGLAICGILLDGALRLSAVGELSWNLLESSLITASALAGFCWLLSSVRLLRATTNCSAASAWSAGLLIAVVAVCLIVMCTLGVRAAFDAIQYLAKYGG
jgi:hypothetical protein